MFAASLVFVAALFLAHVGNIERIMFWAFVIGNVAYYAIGIGLAFAFRDNRAFCKYVCPVGTLEGGIPLVLLNSMMRGALGWLFRWKFLLLILCIVASIFIYRPFCKYVCPLGAFYGLFQKVSLIRMRVDKEKCVDCGICAKTCKMNVDPHKTPNSNECIRCRECIHACPMHALSMNIGPGPVQLPEQEVKTAEEA
jgi:polyferredoxin